MADGAVVLDLALPGRRHGAAFRAAPAHCVVFAVIRDLRGGGDLERGEAVARIDVATGRRFCGHGAFTPDGRHLFTPQIDLDGGRGVIGIRDAADGYRPIGELATGGVGPHEVILMPDGATLVAANGGILTHPDDPGQAQPGHHRPWLAYLDLARGRTHDRFELDARLHQLSIRDLAVNADGLVAMAMQCEGSKRDGVPLVVSPRRRRDPAARGAAALERRLRQYAGGVAFDRAAGSSPCPVPAAI